jgi:hypothetical protein
MKLINCLILRITLFSTAIMLLWTAICFFLQMKEIHDGINEGLTNLKQEFVAKANTTPGFVENLKDYTPLNFIITETTAEDAGGNWLMTRRGNLPRQAVFPCEICKKKLYLY